MGNTLDKTEFLFGPNFDLESAEAHANILDQIICPPR